MPIVPTSTAPDVAPAGLPGVQVQAPYRLLQTAALPGQEMSALGAGMVHAGDEALAEDTRQQITLNEAAAKEHDAKLMGAIQGVLYGTPDDPGKGFLAAKGKDAVDAYQATVEKLKGLPQDLSQGLSNPAQQQLVQTPSQVRVQSAVAQAAQHYSQQSDIYQKAAGEIRIKTAMEGIPLAFNPVTDSPLAKFDQDDPGANSQYQQYMQTVASETRDQATRAGLPQDAADGLVKLAMGKAYVSTVAHLIDRKGGTPADLAVAKAYFDATKDQMPADAQDKVRAVLEAGMKKDQALTTALDVKQQTGDIGKQEKILDDQFKAGTIDATVHDMALQHLRADNAQRRSEQAEGDKSMLGAVWNIARNGGSMTDLSPSQLSYIQQRGLGVHIDQIFNRERNANLDDSQMYSDLMQTSATDPAKFASMDLASLSGQLKESHWNHLVGIQQAINRQDTKAMDVIKIGQDAVKTAHAQMAAAGLNLNPKPNTDAAKQLDTFTTALHDALAAAQTDWQAKKLSPVQMRDDARTITLGMLKDQSLSGTGYFGSGIGQTHLPVWKMTADQKAAPWQIPDADRGQIIDSLRRNGLPTSEDNIQRAYKAHQGVR